MFNYSNCSLLPLKSSSSYALLVTSPLHTLTQAHTHTGGLVVSHAHLSKTSPPTSPSPSSPESSSPPPQKFRQFSQTLSFTLLPVSPCLPPFLSPLYSIH
ncbi:hypothetical protein Ancab_038241 [Ancistrocladus abbreviatus]